jgi:hypothetical protein
MFGCVAARLRLILAGTARKLRIGSRQRCSGALIGRYLAVA